MVMKGFSFLISLAVATSVLFCSSDNRPLTNPPLESETSLSTSVDKLKLIKDVEEKLERGGIKGYGIWKLSEKADDKLFYFIAVNEDTSNSETLRISNMNGKVLFETEANDFGRVFIFNILRQGRPQMIIPSINYGGSSRFFSILDYVDGKVIALSDEDEAQYSGDFTIVPQYQEERYFALPFQILLTEAVASKDAEATVLRYVDGRYLAVGNVSQRDLWTRKKPGPHK